jgi:PknH-like extracellular domain
MGRTTEGTIVSVAKRRARPGRRAVASLVSPALVFALVGCSTIVHGTPMASAPGSAATGSGGPILPAQLTDLLTPSSALSVTPGSPLFETDMQTALFAGADPEHCLGATAYGTYPLFPRDYTGREARTQQDAAQNQHQLLEVSATYPGDFDAAGFLDSVRKTVSDCQISVTAWGDDNKRLTVIPGPLLPADPEVAHWTTNIVGAQWVCDFSVIAKANVVSELVTCSPDRSIDNQVLVAKRLAKIDELLHSTS